MSTIDEGGLRQPPGNMSWRDVYDVYESGKGRRYALLFSVNGGAFLILSLTVEGKLQLKYLATIALGVAVGMLFFNFLMWWDIRAFGSAMAGLGGPKVFTKIGRRVLGSLVALLVLAWVGVIVLVGFALCQGQSPFRNALAADDPISLGWATASCAFDLKQWT